MFMGVVRIYTNRAALGIAECEQALVLDRNLASAHGFIGLGKNFLGRGEETEAHIQEAFRLSPRDIYAYWWMVFVASAKLQLNADRSFGCAEVSRPIRIGPCHTFFSPLR